jgi:hypothetical protein
VNTVSISGHVAGDGELRETRDGRRILNFVVGIEGEGEPYVPVGYILAQGEVPQLHAGDRIFVEGRLKAHRIRGLFLAAKKIRVLNAPNEKEARPEASIATQ